MVTKFESYLQSIGFVPHRTEWKRVNGEKEPVLVPIENVNSHSFSSMGDLDRCWVKDDLYIYYGLNEKDKPPTLITPRPRIVVERKDEPNIINEQYDDAMNIILQKYEPEVILDAIKNKKMFYEIKGIKVL